VHLPTEGWPGWVGLSGLDKYRDGIDQPKVVTNRSTKRTRRRLTSLMWRRPLPLRHTSHFLTYFTAVMYHYTATATGEFWSYSYLPFSVNSVHGRRSGGKRRRVQLQKPRTPSRSWWHFVFYGDSSDHFITYFASLVIYFDSRIVLSILMASCHNCSTCKTQWHC